jgi:polyisoprenyl-phosphate glycosyltransferase
MKKSKLSVVVPVYYNSESLHELHSRLLRITDENPDLEIEIVYVDDGSGDDSFNTICSIAAKDSRVVAVKLSRNFGSFIACLAGLTRCNGDCAVIISADLQDPPELIGEMYKKWCEGSKVVMAVRENRQEGFIKTFFANMYYRLFRLFITKEMPPKGFDFVLIDRKVIDVLTSIQEKNTTLMGLILWTGFNRTEIPYTRMKRKHGKSRWTLSKKINYFLDSMMAFSRFPMHVFSMFGILLSLVSLISISYIIFAYLVGWINGVSGWPSLMVVNLFMFGMLFLAFGMLGEYVWRNLEEARKRPLFIIDSEYQGASSEEKRGVQT